LRSSSAAQSSSQTGQTPAERQVSSERDGKPPSGRGTPPEQTSPSSTERQSPTPQTERPSAQRETVPQSGTTPTEGPTPSAQTEESSAPPQSGRPPATPTPSDIIENRVGDTAEAEHTIRHHGGETVLTARASRGAYSRGVSRTDVRGDGRVDDEQGGAAGAHLTGEGGVTTTLGTRDASVSMTNRIRAEETAEVEGRQVININEERTSAESINRAQARVRFTREGEIGVNLGGNRISRGVDGDIDGVVDLEVTPRAEIRRDGNFRIGGRGSLQAGMTLGGRMRNDAQSEGGSRDRESLRVGAGPSAGYALGGEISRDDEGYHVRLEAAGGHGLVTGDYSRSITVSHRDIHERLSGVVGEERARQIESAPARVVSRAHQVIHGPAAEAAERVLDARDAARERISGATDRARSWWRSR